MVRVRLAVPPLTPRRRAVTVGLPFCRCPSLEAKGGGSLNLQDSFHRTRSRGMQERRFSPDAHAVRWLHCLVYSMTHLVILLILWCPWLLLSVFSHQCYSKRDLPVSMACSWRPVRPALPSAGRRAV